MSALSFPLDDCLGDAARRLGQPPSSPPVVRTGMPLLDRFVSLAHQPAPPAPTPELAPLASVAQSAVQRTAVLKLAKIPLYRAESTAVTKVLLRNSYSWFYCYSWGPV